MEEVESKVKALLGEVLGSASIDFAVPFMDMGLDSLSQVEFRNRLQSMFSTKLAATAMFDYPTVAALSGMPKPRNPRHFDRFEGGRTRVSDTSTHKNSGSAEHNHCFMHYFGVKTLSETLFPPPLMKPGYGARFKGAWQSLVSLS